MAAKKTTRSLCRAIVARQVFEIVHSRCVARALRLVCFQYFCQETRTDEKKESPPMGFALEAENPGDVGLFPRETSPEDINANNFIRPQRFSCKGSDTDPAAYSAYRYDGGRTFSFKLDEAMAITVEDDKINEIAIDTWFMPRYTKHK
jgi:hypothetical protein